MLKSQRKNIIEGLKRDVALLNSQIAKMKEDRKRSNSKDSYDRRIEVEKKQLEDRKHYLKMQKEALKTDFKG